MEIRPPTNPPCGSCPYRLDVPSGVWSKEEYEKLPHYDRVTPEQPTEVFLCHQQNGRVCGGWAACHGAQVGQHALFSVRIGVSEGTVTREVAEAIWDYESSVPTWSSGELAAVYGLLDVEDPSPRARSVMHKVVRTRNNLGRKDAEDPGTPGDAEELPC
jgi:hypothetical protein